MLNFFPIHFTDRQAFSDILRQYPQASTDYTFSNLYGWRMMFHTECVFVADMFMIRFFHKGTFGYMMPVGARDKVVEAVELLVEDAEAHKRPFLMKGVTVSMCEELNDKYPNRFVFSPDHDNDEYIYLTEKLADLSGKKFQSKRNHINRFKEEHPDWEYVRIKNTIETRVCIEMLDQWMHTFSPGIAVTRRYDYRATRTMLRHFNYLGLSGGFIRTGGKVVAFALGEPLTADTFVVHVEKAFGDIQGAYSLINQQFAIHEAASFTFINREEDMGLENIRKAKLSYHPTALLEHFTVTLR
jgi:hypothetical protein